MKGRGWWTRPGLDRWLTQAFSLAGLNPSQSNAMGPHLLQLSTPFCVAEALEAAYAAGQAEVRTPPTPTPEPGRS